MRQSRGSVSTDKKSKLYRAIKFEKKVGLRKSDDQSAAKR